MMTFDDFYANLTVEQIRDRVGATSLGYLSIRGLVDATGRAVAFRTTRGNFR